MRVARSDDGFGDRVLAHGLGMPPLLPLREKESVKSGKANQVLTGDRFAFPLPLLPFASRVPNRPLASFA
jgi:hypothetical protein